MRLPFLLLAHIATAHRHDLHRTATTGEGSNASSVAATATQNFTAVLETHGSDRAVLSQADLGIPGKLKKKPALILVASTVLGGPQRAVEAWGMPRARVAAGSLRNALNVPGFRLDAKEVAEPGSGMPDPSGWDSSVDEVLGTTANLKNHLKGLDDIGEDELKIEQEDDYQSLREELLEYLRNNADAVLQFAPSEPEEKESRERILETFDVEGIAKYIAEKEVRRIVVMCGAGISTSAGIPDFRSPGSGLYDNLQKYSLPSPEAIFSLDYFRQHPGAFYELACEMWPGKFLPTPAHYFIRLLHEKGLLLRCYSQNIDSLERLAGLPSSKLVAAHGNFDEAHVIDREPEVSVDIAELKAALEEGEAGWQRLREEKGGLVKPKIVFFGEGLPERFALSMRDLPSCDLLLVLGTSLLVAPFCELVGLANPAAPRLLINREAAGTYLAKGFRFHKRGENENWRDAFCAGDIDEGVRSLTKALGWDDELEALIESKGLSQVQPAPWATLENEA